MNNGEFKNNQFDNPRSLRLYKLLNLLGDGPAIFYRDACFLMKNEIGLTSTSHLITHLFREIESSIRSVLDPKFEEKEGHEKSIKNCFLELDIDLNDNVAKAWLSITKEDSEFRLPKYAHRNNLDSPRPITKELKKHWENVEEIFELILEKFESNYLKTIDRLDMLIAEDHLSNSNINELKRNIPNNLITRKYYFSNLKSKKWLKPLFDACFFSNPPFKIVDVETKVEKYIPWPESQYLACMASKAPKDVKNIIKNMSDTDNPFVHSNLLDAMLSMPSDLASELSLKVRGWISESSVRWNTEKYAKLVKHFLVGGKIDCAIELSRELFKLLPDTDYEAKKQYKLTGPEPRSYFEKFWLKEIIDQLLPVYIEKAGFLSLELFSDILEDGVKFTKHQDSEGNDRFYYGPFHGIEDFEQRRLDNDPIDIITFAVRSIADQIIQNNGIKVLEVIEHHEFDIFKRISIYLRWKYPEIDREGTIRILSNVEYYGNMYIFHEFYHLLHVCFGRMSKEKQNVYFDYILKETKIIKGLPEDEKKRKNRELFDYLYPIREHLTGTWKTKFKKLSKEYKPTKYPDFLVYMDDDIQWSSGFRTPKTRDDLASMTIDELISYLSEIKPTGKQNDYDTLEGLSIIIQDLSASNPDYYSFHAERFIGLLPPFVNGLLHGLHTTLKQSKPFKQKNWNNVLNLCKWVTEQERDEKLRWGHYSDMDPGWGWTRKTIAEILDDTLKQEKNIIPLQKRKKIWEVLLPLTLDPHPNEEYEKESTFEPFTMAINTVRGKAIEAVIQYSRWVYNNIYQGKNIRISFSEIPEVRIVLEKHLDKKQDPSLAFHSIYGQKFSTLVFLDEKWAKDNVEKIFPLDDNNKKYFYAAWGAYIKFNRPYKKVFEILKDIYVYAIEHIDEFPEYEPSLARVDERLTEHLITFFWNGAIGIKSPKEFLPLFYEKASEKLCTHALEFIGKNLHEATDEVVPRLQKFWEYRLNKAKSCDKKELFINELSTFGYWFISNKFDVKWRIIQLESVLEICGKVEMDKDVLEILEKMSEEYSLNVIKCLKLIIIGSKDTWHISYLEKNLMNILRKVIQEENKKARKEVINLVHRLGSMGYLNFRELLKV